MGEGSSKTVALGDRVKLAGWKGDTTFLVVDIHPGVNVYIATDTCAGWGWVDIQDVEVVEPALLRPLPEEGGAS
jgi:hypothetical protein